MDIQITPHGKAIVLTLHEASEGAPFWTFDAGSMERAAERLSELVAWYAPGVVTPALRAGEPLGGVVIEPGEHGCLTVRAASDTSARHKGEVRVYIDFPTAAGLAQYLRRAARGIPEPRRRRRAHRVR